MQGLGVFALFGAGYFCVSVFLGLSWKRLSLFSSYVCSVLVGLWRCFISGWFFSPLTQNLWRSPPGATLAGGEGALFGPMRTLRRVLQILLGGLSLPQQFLVHVPCPELSQGPHGAPQHVCRVLSAALSAQCPVPLGRCPLTSGCLASQTPR